MPEIDISGLPKEKVILALLKNVFERSESAILKCKIDRDRHKGNTPFDPFQDILMGKPRPNAGLPSEYLLAIFRNTKAQKLLDTGADPYYADHYFYIGPILLNIDFSTDLIDTSHYDSWHATRTTEGVREASEVIALLRQEQAMQTRVFHRPTLVKMTQSHRLIKYNLKECIQVSEDRYQCPDSDNPLMEIEVSKEPGSTTPWADYFECRSAGYEDGYHQMSCSGKDTYLVKRPKAQREFATASEPSTFLNALGSTAAYSAALTAGSELIGDACYLSGIASKESAETIKTAASLALTCLSGAWVSMAVSYSTSTLLEKAGYSQSMARIGGQTVAMAVNVGLDLTPIGLAKTAASTAVSLLAGRFGLFTEKCLVKGITSLTPQVQNY